MKKSILDFYDCIIVFTSYYFKPLLVTLGLYPYIIYFFNLFILKIILILNYFFLNINIFLKYIVINIFPSIFIKTLSLSSIIFSIKFIFLISLFIFARGGIPRYRYDFLTKVG